MEKNEKFDKVLDYFKELNITLPTDVRNAIEDVFSENDEIEEVECYHQEDIQEFQRDISPKNDVKMSLTGASVGSICNVWTYYGGVEYTLTEKIVLLGKDGEELEVISELNPSLDAPYSIVINPSSYQVVLIERVNWDSSTGEFGRHPHLYIYCPITGEGLDESEAREDAKFNNIYNQLMGGGSDYGR